MHIYICIYIYIDRERERETERERERESTCLRLEDVAPEHPQRHEGRELRGGAEQQSLQNGPIIKYNSLLKYGMYTHI